MLNSSQNNIDSAFGSVRNRTVQLGFPVELTAAWSDSAGYAWKRLFLDDLTVTDPSLQETGDRAVTPDNDETLTSGTRGWLEPDPGAAGWVFIPDPASATNTPPAASAAAACAWLAGLSSTDCLLLTVVSKSGRCSGIDLTQALYLIWDGTNSWDSAGDFDHTGSATDPGPVVFTDSPSMTIAGVSGKYLGCGGGKLLFAFNTNSLCDSTATAAACANYFIVAVECADCDEATVGVDCCAGELPATLTLSFDAAAPDGNVTLTYDPVDGRWEGTGPLCGFAGTHTFECVGPGNSWTWTFTRDIGGGKTSTAAATCSPFSWASSAQSPFAEPENTCTAPFTATVSE